MKPVKLIFVDDDPDNRELIRENLTELGASDFLVLESGSALYKFLGLLQELPEAIVLDLNMPEMDGMQILKHLKRIDLYQKIPIYILTTSSQEYLRQQCIQEGAAEFYTKPNSISELNTILSEIYQTI